MCDNVEKCGAAGQATDDNKIRRMRFACWITKATDTRRNMEYLLLFHCNSGYKNAPQSYVIRALPFFYNFGLPISLCLIARETTQKMLSKNVSSSIPTLKLYEV